MLMWTAISTHCRIPSSTTAPGNSAHFCCWISSSTYRSNSHQVQKVYWVSSQLWNLHDLLFPKRGTFPDTRYYPKRSIRLDVSRHHWLKSFPQSERSLFWSFCLVQKEIVIMFRIVFSRYMSLFTQRRNSRYLSMHRLVRIIISTVFAFRFWAMSSNINHYGCGILCFWDWNDLECDGLCIIDYISQSTDSVSSLLHRYSVPSRCAAKD